MKFAEFPIDILSQIVSVPAYSFLVIPLLQCGDTLLSRKLALGMTLIDLVNFIDNSTPQLPKCISSFPNLRSLHYYERIRLTEPYISEFYTRLLTLPSMKLESLIIKMKDFNMPRLLERKHLLESTNPDRASTALLLPFCHLVTLHIPYGDPWETFHLALLPSTLTDLASPGFSFSVTTCQELTFSSLPKGLLVWRATIRCVNDFESAASVDNSLFWQNPPPHLHRIECIDFSYFEWSNQIALMLPRSLITCDFRRVPPPTLTFISRLPVGLRNISVGTISLEFALSYGEKWRSAWGDRVGTLYLVDSDATFTAGNISSVFRSMPTSITSIHLVMDPNTLSAISAKDWPPHLSELNFTALRPAYMDHLLESIPATLSSLKISRNVVLSNFVATKLFPTSLTSLHFAVEVAAIVFSFKLPETLVELGIMRVPLVQDEEPHRIPPIDFTSQCLPRLQVLQLNDWPYAQLNLIPRSVTRLEIKHLTTSQDNFHSSFCTSHSPSSNIDPSIEPQISCHFKLGHALPPLLRFLILGSFYPLFWTDPCFEALPHLRLLFIHKIGQFGPQVLAQLPSRLAALQIKLSHFNDEHGPLLNPNWDCAYIHLKNSSRDCLLTYSNVN